MRLLNRPLAKAAYFVVALPTVVGAARKVARLGRTLPFDELLDRLREGTPTLPPALASRPLWLAGTVEALLPFLPPRSWGPCLRRALVVLELWSRCGLRPRFYLGVRPEKLTLEAHAWLTAELADGSLLRSSDALGHLEAFEL